MPRIKSSELIKTKLPEIADGISIIITGDFNCRRDTGEYKSLRTMFNDSHQEFAQKNNIELENLATFHGWSLNRAVQKKWFKKISYYIDFIFYNGDLEVADSKILDYNGIQKPIASDHWPVQTIFDWK